MDKCPKCGVKAVERIGDLYSRFACGTETFSGEEEKQSEFCRTRCELAALHTRHQRLVEAARKAANQYSCELVEDCDCLMCSLYKIVKEENALESEAKP